MEYAFTGCYHPKGRKTITLSEYRNKKLIILDFWATWCSPCIASLDKSIPIYNRHKTEMMLLPIASHNGPSKQLAEDLMKSKSWNVPSVYYKTQFLFKKVFPPPFGSGIPYIIWIKEGKVLAIPKTEYVTEENIVKAIKGEKLDFALLTFVFLLWYIFNHKRHKTLQETNEVFSLQNFILFTKRGFCF